MEKGPNLVVKFERFFELNLSVSAKFHIILYLSRMKCFALDEYYSYLVVSLEHSTHNPKSNGSDLPLVPGDKKTCKQ
jgi:hypothetical protein